MAEQRHQRGFTLFELMVALAVFGLLVAGLAQGLHLGLRAWNAQARAVDARDELDATDRALRHILSHLDPGNGARPLPLLGTSTDFSFTSELPAAAALSTRLADMRLFVDAQNRLVLSWRVHRHEHPLAPPPPPTVTELLNNVARIELSYWQPVDAAGDPAHWRDQWSGPALPGLVRLHLVFEKGDARRWPDIIVAPALQQGNG